MTHQCRDCSYKGKRLQQGVCPACGSANIGRIKTQEEHNEKASGPISTIVMVLLWCALGYLLYGKFA